MCSSVESGFWLCSQKREEWQLSLLLSTRKQGTDGTGQLVATKDDLKKIETLLNIVDVIESCTKEQANTMWKLYKLMNVTFFAALVMEVPMGCKNAILPEPLVRNGSVKRLTFKRSTRKPYIDNFACLFRALTLHLLKNDGLEEQTSNLLAAYPYNMAEVDAANFQGVCMKAISTVEDFTETNIFFVRHCYCGWSSCWRTCDKEHRKVIQHCEVATLQ